MTTCLYACDWVTWLSFLQFLVRFVDLLICSCTFLRVQLLSYIPTTLGSLMKLLGMVMLLNFLDVGICNEGGGKVESTCN